MCQLTITYQPQDDVVLFTITENPDGVFNGKDYWNFDLTEGSSPVGNVYIYFDTTLNQWVLNNTLGTSSPEAFLNSTSDCPEGEWILATPKLLYLKTEDATIEDSCDCGILLVWTNPESDIFWNFEIQSTGSQYGRNVYEFDAEIGGVTYSFILGWNPAEFRWEIANVDTFQTIAVLPYNSTCPLGDKWSALSIYSTTGLTTTKVDCETCGNEERIFREYKSIKLPEVFVEQNRGLRGCCECEYLVLADNSGKSFQNDVTSAWLKLSDPSDSVVFELQKGNGSLANYQPSPQPFVNEPDAFFCTIKWSDVLNDDGAGCFNLIVKYNISGIIAEFTWGQYKLQPFTIQNALKTARVRAKFNTILENEGINFTDSNVESTFRFFGFIGNRQPNAEIDNIIYSDRQMKSVIRENLNEYEITTDPVLECFTRPLIELYLLSENELFISDYNAHNHSYRFNDLPVIVEKSPELEYPKLTRYAVLTCKVGDKFKNKRTYY
jgi:hypothetical protein